MEANLLSLLQQIVSKPADKRFREFVDLLTRPPEERRSHERIPCCRRAIIYPRDGTGPIPGVLRDLSEQGIGLLHEVPLKKGEVCIRITLDDNQVVCAKIDIAWCRWSVKHCYISGGQFVDVFIDDPISLSDG
jgi:hypothetical protein